MPRSEGFCAKVGKGKWVGICLCGYGSKIPDPQKKTMDKGQNRPNPYVLHVFLHEGLHAIGSVH